MVSTATPPIAPARSRSRGRSVLRVLIALFLLVVVLIVAAMLWFRHAAHAALPQLDGSIKVSGLTAPVHVIRDAQGVPHITAASLHDLFFAQGYVTAQDRLWQMDLSRRHAAGELAEVFGERALQSDVTHRTLQRRNMDEYAANHLSGCDSSFYIAYTV